MGNVWSVEESNSSKLQILNTVDCKTAQYISKEMVKGFITKNKNIKNFKSTSDYKKYGLIPGQGIFYKGLVGNNIHPAVYLYNGLVMEMGSAPKSCKENTGWTTSYFGLNSLEEFVNYGKNVRKSDTYKVITKKDGDNKTVLTRLQRGLKTIGFQDFRVFSNNCIQKTNYVIFGKHLNNFPEGVVIEKLNF